MNLSCFGEFRLLVEITDMLAPSSALMAFFFRHGVNFAAMTLVSAAMQIHETGRLPADWAEFFLQNLANYVVIAGVSAALQAAAKPLFQARINTVARSLD